MDTCIVKGIFPSRHTQKACTLFKGFCSQLCHFHKLFSVGKRSVFFTVGNDVFCNGAVYSRNIGKQRIGGCIKVNAHRVHTVLYHSFKSLVHTGFGHIVLVLSHADSLGVYLYKLCKGVLHSSCDRNRRTQRNVIVRELLSGKL